MRERPVFWRARPLVIIVSGLRPDYKHCWHAKVSPKSRCQTCSFSPGGNLYNPSLRNLPFAGQGKPSQLHLTDQGPCDAGKFQIRCDGPISNFLKNPWQRYDTGVSLRWPTSCNLSWRCWLPGPSVVLCELTGQTRAPFPGSDFVQCCMIPIPTLTLVPMWWVEDRAISKNQFRRQCATSRTHSTSCRRRRCVSTRCQHDGLSCLVDRTTYRPTTPEARTIGHSVQRAVGRRSNGHLPVPPAVE